MRPATAHDGLHPRLHPGVDALEPGRVLEVPAGIGLSLLTRLDALGGRVVRRHAARRAAITPTSRISASTAVVLAGAASLTGLFAWGVLDAAGGSNAWMTAPGAGNAEAVVQATGPAPGHQVAGAVPAAHAPTPPLTVHEGLVLLDGGMTGHPGWPEIVGSASIDLPANARVVLTITSFDDGPAPLAKGLPYDKVMGTLGGNESYDGTTITSVANKDIAHTFTVPGIGLNLPIPAAESTKGGAITPAVVTATFVTSKKGSFTWQCYAPCGSGAEGNGGPMKTPGFMTGTVRVG